MDNWIIIDETGEILFTVNQMSQELAITCHARGHLVYERKDTRKLAMRGFSNRQLECVHDRLHLEPA
jgi:hypothetical protein